jgi:homoserine kinase
VIRVPASIGNVGPGFDTLGLALSLYLRVKVLRVIDDGRGTLTTRFPTERPRSEDRIWHAFQTWPFRTKRPRSLEVAVDSDIPERAGLGSSAAAAIAGLKLRELSDGARSVDEILAAAAALEGHPDNAAAALFGGLTSSLADGDRITVAKWKWPAAWRVAIATPHQQLATAESRRAIPPVIPLEDVIFNLQHVAMLIHAVATKNADAMTCALQDRTHQPYREPLVPVLGRALSLRHRDLMGVCLSGAGPSVAAFVRRPSPGVERALTALYRKEGVRCTVRTWRIHQ